MYYLMYAIQHGAREHATLLTGLTLTTIAASVAAHGISVTPLMNLYERATEARRPARGGSATAHTEGTEEVDEEEGQIA